jgi:hypothetical protein
MENYDILQKPKIQDGGNNILFSRLQRLVTKFMLSTTVSTFYAENR